MREKGMQREKEHSAKNKTTRCGNPADLARFFCTLNCRNEQAPYACRNHNPGGKAKKKRLSHAFSLATDKKHRRSAKRRTGEREARPGGRAKKRIHHFLHPFAP